MPVANVWPSNAHKLIESIAEYKIYCTARLAVSYDAN